MRKCLILWQSRIWIHIFGVSFDQVCQIFGQLKMCMHGICGSITQ